MTLRSCLLAFLLCSAPAAGLAQGVLVAPTSVFIDARARTASVLLVNPNDDPVEIELSTLFGYTMTDSAGRVELYMTDTPEAGAPSAVEWIRIFPRRLSIAPRAQQTIRLLVQPPATLPDGEYWARLVVLARGGKLPMTAASDTGVVQVGLSVEVRTILPILYRKGQVVSSAGLAGVRASTEGDSLVVRGRITRDAGAAVLGTVRGEVVDSAGAVRATFMAPVSAYVAVEPRFTVPLDSLGSGTHRVRVELSSGRLDLPAESVLPFRTVRDSTTVRLP